jgi:hypothetical protein
MGRKSHRKLKACNRIFADGSFTSPRVSRAQQALANKPVRRAGGASIVLGGETFFLDEPAVSRNQKQQQFHEQMPRVSKLAKPQEQAAPKPKPSKHVV